MERRCQGEMEMNELLTGNWSYAGYWIIICLSWDSIQESSDQTNKKVLLVLILLSRQMILLSFTFCNTKYIHWWKLHCWRRKLSGHVQLSWYDAIFIQWIMWNYPRQKANKDLGINLYNFHYTQNSQNSHCTFH